ncbi:hypothetical protein ACHQM5_016554 [Ranunculus cassubicifolius]
MARTSLGPGFRFHPTDVELICYYLKRKVLRKKLIEAIAELDLYKFSPWDLPDKSCVQSKDREWYFFCPKDRKYANGVRTNRSTEIGYWKSTGKDRAICNESKTVGTKKTLVFHLGRAPRGDRTDWVMHEYRLEMKDLADAGISQDSYVICKIFQKSGAGPKNGEEHGAPFKEEEWENDSVDDSLIPLPPVRISSPSVMVDEISNTVTGDDNLVLRKTHESSVKPPWHNTLVDGSSENLSILEQFDMDSIFVNLDGETELRPSANANNERTELLDYDRDGEASLPSNDNRHFDSLEDLLTGGNGIAVENCNADVLGQTPPFGGYLELDDLDGPVKYPVGVKSGLTKSTSSLFGENVSSMRLQDLDIPPKYPLNTQLNNASSGKQFDYNNCGSAEIVSSSFTSSGIGSQSNMLPWTYTPFANIMNMASNGNLSAPWGEGGDMSGFLNNPLSRETLPSMRLEDLDSPMKYPLEASHENISHEYQFGFNNLNTLEGCFNPFVSSEAVYPVSGAGSSNYVPPRNSGAFVDNLNVASNLYNPYIGGFEGASSSAGGYKDANQNPENLLGGEMESIYKSNLSSFARGENQRGNSRLQCLLGSIPARPASAAEFPSSVNAGKGSMGTSLKANHGDSSLPVLGESSYYMCCGTKPPTWLKKAPVSYRNDYTFVFFLGGVTALIWLVFFSLVIKLGWSAWKLIIS